MTETILHLGRPTFSDKDYYSRWEAAGKVITPGTSYKHEDVTALVVDQHTKAWPVVLPQLKFVLSATTGHTHLSWVKPPAIIISLRGEVEFLKSIKSVAEFTFLQMLTLLRAQECPRLASGKRLAIIGVGRIGKHVWDLSRAFGMETRGYDVGTKAPSTLRSLFEWADMVSLHISENQTTVGMINAGLINAMKPGAILINTARPSVIDNEALYTAVQLGRIKAAVDFECFGNKPDIVGLLKTKHIAGTTLEDRVRTDEFLIRKFLKLVSV